MKEQKQALARLMALGNPDADKYLSGFAEEIMQKITASDDNDKIFDYLDLLEEFVYKVPKKAFEIVSHVIQHPHSSKNLEPSRLAIKGLDYKDVGVKALRVLERIRYYDSIVILPLLVKLIRDSGSPLCGRAKEVLKKFTEYNYVVLSKTTLGYAPQRQAVDFSMSLSNEELEDNIDFIRIVSEEVLSTDTSGTSSTDPDTLVIHRGSVAPTSSLATIRRDQIDVLIRLYNRLSTGKEKIGIIALLEAAIQPPMDAEYGKELIDILEDDIRYLLHFYRRILFQEGKLVGDPAVAESLDQHLFWLLKNDHASSKEIRSFREELLADKFYSLFRIMVGDYMLYREENGWDDADKKRNDELDKLVQDIDETNIDEWTEKLNRIASCHETVDEWKFNYFKGFIWKLGIKKPEFSFRIMSDALKHSKPLKAFVWGTLIGCRDSEPECIELWKALVESIATQHEKSLVASIVDSLVNEHRGARTWDIRKQDIDVVEKILKKQGEFSFLKSWKDLSLEYSILRTLLSNYQAFPKRIEPMIALLLKESPEWAVHHIQTVEFAQMSKWIDLSLFSKTSVTFLKNLLINIRDLDWHAQGVLLALGRKNPSIIFEVFNSRMNWKGQEGMTFRDRYTAIPSHMNRELISHLESLSDLDQYLGSMIVKVGLRWSHYSSNLGQLLSELGPTISERILRSVIKKGDVKSLWKAVIIMRWHFQEPNLALFIEIVSKTNEKKIWNELSAMLASVSGVHDVDGLARIFEARALQLRPYLDHKNVNVKQFAEQQIAYMKIRAEDERKRAAEDRQLRKTQFGD